ncbi:hypothetical protein AAHC03_091 [Spirometra sp. Aus1]
MHMVDAEDRSSPSTFPLGLRDHRRAQMFGVYEEVLSIRIPYLRHAPRSQQYPSPSHSPPFVSVVTDYDVLT